MYRYTKVLGTTYYHNPVLSMFTTTIDGGVVFCRSHQLPLYEIDDPNDPYQKFARNPLNFESFHSLLAMVYNHSHLSDLYPHPFQVKKLPNSHLD